MANTTNYNWETPDDTDLVKDGAAAIRTLGSSIDTTTKNLNPETTLGDIAYRSATANTNTRLAIGTTGQVLTVAGGVPSWATPTTGDIEGVTAGTGISGGGTSGTVTITNSMATAIDAKGDLIVGTGADTFSRLAVGTNGHTLVADSAQATGLKWASPSSGALSLVYSNTFSAGQTVSFDNVFTSTYRDYRIVVTTTTGSGTNENLYLRLRASGTDASTNYKTLRTLNNGSAVTGDTDPVGTTYFYFYGVSNTHPTLSSAVLDVIRPENAVATHFKNQLFTRANAGDVYMMEMQGYNSNATSYDGFSIIASAGTVTGDVRVYGYQNS